MTEELTDEEKRRGLPWAVAHCAGNSVFSQLTFFGPVFLLFLNALGFEKTRIGLLLSFLPFCGLLAPFIASTVGRAGVKRVFVAFWLLRKLVTACLLLTPYVAERFGREGTFAYVAALMAAFALCRAIGETGFYPWFQEVVPARIRGQYTAIESIAGTVSGGLALAVASVVMGKNQGIGAYMGLIGAGVAFGLICVACAAKIPGGAPGRQMDSADLRGVLGAVRDRNFRRFLVVAGAVSIVLALFSFGPLFMKEIVGLREDRIVVLQIAGMVGSVLSSYLWGWLSDRRGSKPVMLVVLSLMGLFPAAWMALPRHSPWSYPLALAIACAWGMASIGFFLSKFRMLYVGLVPPERKIQYIAFYYAWIGLLGGIGPISAGRVLDAFRGLSGRLWVFNVDAYTPLFAAAFVLTALSLGFAARIRTDREQIRATEEVAINRENATWPQDPSTTG